MFSSSPMFSLNNPPGLCIRQHPAWGPKISKPAQPLEKMGRGSTRLKHLLGTFANYGLWSFAQRINFFNYSSSHAQLWHMCIRGVLFPKLHLFLAMKVIRQKMVFLELCKQPFKFILSGSLLSETFIYKIGRYSMLVATARVQTQR